MGAPPGRASYKVVSLESFHLNLNLLQRSFGPWQRYTAYNA